MKKYLVTIYYSKQAEIEIEAEDKEIAETLAEAQLFSNIDQDALEVLNTDIECLDNEEDGI